MMRYKVYDIELLLRQAPVHDVGLLGSRHARESHVGKHRLVAFSTPDMELATDRVVWLTVIFTHPQRRTHALIRNSANLFVHAGLTEDQK